MHLRRRKSGFSLVEVALSLGVISFALTAILGLVIAALNSGKASTDDTIQAACANNVLSDLRRLPFDQISTNVATAPTIYFDGGGNRLNASGVSMTRDNALSNGAVYQCTQTVQNDISLQSANGTNNLFNISLTFAWPVAATTPPNTKLIQASVARY